MSFKTSIKITSRGYFYIFRGYFSPREAIYKKNNLKRFLGCRSAELKIFSVFLCQRCREIWREILVTFFALHFPGFGCATENFNKISRQKTVWKKKRRISREFHSAGAQRWWAKSPESPAERRGPEGPTIKTFQSRSRCSISILENFNLDVSISPQKLGPPWVARSKISFLLEIFNLARNLEFFDLWALWGFWARKSQPEIANR